ncbi:hypothetical protein HK101_001703 [Irineochytrium annulatum]|nr:hypothetical protein HK101_001703 [Irineochytrium annulatum]
MTSTRPSTQSQVVLVTGANKGIGFEAVRLLSERLDPSTVILMGTRLLENGKSAVASLRSRSFDSSAPPSSTAPTYANVVPIELDVTKDDSIKRAVEHIRAKYGRLDVLISNAGVYHGNEGNDEETFDVNFYGVRAVALAFLPLMRPGSKLIVNTSTAGSVAFNLFTDDVKATLGDLEHLSWPVIESYAHDYLKMFVKGKPNNTWPARDKAYGGYGVSKAFANSFVRLFAKEHPEIETTTVCPGYCATDLSTDLQKTRPGAKTAAQGAESIIWPVFNKAKQGAFYRDGNEQPYDIAPK